MDFIHQPAMAASSSSTVRRGVTALASPAPYAARAGLWWYILPMDINDAKWKIRPNDRSEDHHKSSGNINKAHALSASTLCCSCQKIQGHRCQSVTVLDNRWSVVWGPRTSWQVPFLRVLKCLYPIESFISGAWNFSMYALTIRKCLLIIHFLQVIRYLTYTCSQVNKQVPLLRIHQPSARLKRATGKGLDKLSLL